jgi:Domain of unknown function (DUF4397)
MKKLITGTLFLSMILAACNPAPIPDTFIRYVNASSDSEGIKVFNKGILVAGSGIISFKNALPSLNTYLTLPTGTLTYSLCPQLLQDCPALVKDKTVNLIAEAQTTLYLVGTSDTTDDSGSNPRPLEVIQLDAQTTTPATGKIKIRVLHATTLPTAKSIDLYILPPNAPLSGLTLPLNYKGTTSYNTFDAGSYRISAALPGVTDTTVVKSESISLDSGKTYTAVLVNPDVNGFGVILLTDK